MEAATEGTVRYASNGHVVVQIGEDRLWFGDVAGDASAYARALAWAAELCAVSGDSLMLGLDDGATLHVWADGTYSSDRGVRQSVPVTSNAFPDRSSSASEPDELLDLESSDDDNTAELDPWAGVDEPDVVSVPVLDTQPEPAPTPRAPTPLRRHMVRTIKLSTAAVTLAAIGVLGADQVRSPAPPSDDLPVATADGATRPNLKPATAAIEPASSGLQVPRFTAFVNTTALPDGAVRFQVSRLSGGTRFTVQVRVDGKTRQRSVVMRRASTVVTGGVRWFV